MSNSDYDITGFESPCTEFREKNLSLDERYQIDRPQTFIVEIKGDSHKLGLKSGDKLILNRSLIPHEDQLVLLVIKNEFKLGAFSTAQLKDQDPETGDFVWGVVTTLLRELK